MSTEASDLALNENEHIVARTDELDDGDRIIALLNGKEIGVFNVDGELHAYPNWCAPRVDRSVKGRSAEPSRVSSTASPSKRSSSGPAKARS